MSETKPYIPENAKVNVTNNEMSPPKTKYENRKFIINRETVKDKITKKDTP